MVYTALVRVSGTGNQSQWRTFLTLYHFGLQPDQRGVQTYPVQLRKGELFLPQWSPDGKQVLLKVGNAGDRYNVYLIHFWNPEKGEIVQGPREYVSFLKPQWSPNSQQVAYIVGGDIAGRVDRPDPIELRVYDLATQQSRLLVSAIPTVGTPADFAWTHNDTVLYTQPTPLMRREAKPEAPSQTPKDLKTASAAQWTPPPRPSIYEVGAKSGTPKLLIRDGYKAAPSPTGRFVAFFGWATEEQAARRTQN
ncbi:MAG TPA: hypothetical protein VF627_05175 [Abditibacterium sp.]